MEKNNLNKINKFLSQYKNDSHMYVEFPHKKYWNKSFKKENLNEFIMDSIKEKKDEKFLYYVHIPHCHTQCLYCTCHVEITKDYNVVKRYLEFLHKEIDLQSKLFKDMNHYPEISHLHFGGGSPTFLKKPEFNEVLKKLSYFINFKKLKEFAIEIDPRRIKEDMMYYYNSIGINRISFGIQEFDKKVQQNVARVQPAFLTERLLTKEIRSLFPNGVNFDLICGLPGQNLENFKFTIDKTIEMSPDRICLNYMHLSPKFHPHQLKMPKDQIPEENQRKELFMLAEEMLTNNNYIRAGYDHFVKKTDYLAGEFGDKKSGWDRLGIVSGEYNNIFGSGVSSTCKVDGKIYYQNTFENTEYEDLLNQKKLPICNFHICSKEDVIREKVITEIRQFFSINKKEINEKYDIKFDDFFKTELQILQKFIDHNLVINRDESLELTSYGKEISNLLASKFDNYISLSQRSL